MESKKKVGIWIRVSHENSVKTESPQHHEERARWYCNSKGWEVATVYSLEAISGKSVIELPETKRMLKDIENGLISGLVFSKLARVARNTKELLFFSEVFREYNADLVSLEESIDTSTPAGRLFYTLIAAMAQWEREETASRVAASIPVRARLGKLIGGAPSFGFRFDKAHNRLVVDENEGPVRKLMYEIFAKCKRKRTTAKELNSRGYRTRKGQLFTDTTIDRLIRDTTAKGIRRANYTRSRGDKKNWDLKPKTDWIFTECEAIVSNELWNECNHLLDGQYRERQKPGRQSQYLLAGFISCRCGKKMYVFHTNKKYLCKSCKSKISVEDIDEIFKLQLKKFLFTDDEMSTYQKQAASVLDEKSVLYDISQAEFKNLAEKMEKLVSMRMDNELDAESFAQYYQPLKKRHAEVETQISHLQGEIDFLRVQKASSETVLADAHDLYSRWPQLGFEDQRSIVEAITEQIVIEEKDIRIRLAYLPNHLGQTAGKRQRNLMDSWRSPA